MASSLSKPTLRIDQPRDPVGGASVLATGGALASPAIPLPGPPTELAVMSTALARSAVTPKAVANLSWRPPRNVPVGSYLIQWATDSGFTIPIGWDVPRDKVTAAIPDLPTSPATGTTTVWFRIATVSPAGLVGAYSAAVSAAMPKDTTAPAAPGNLTVVFLADGTARISWVKPTSANFRAVEIRIFNTASKAVEYEVIQEADGTVYDWLPARNRAQTVGSPDGSPDTAIYVEVRSVSWGGVYSAAVNASATSARPANVSGATATWDGATGTCRFKWNAVAGAVRYDLTIDGTTRPVAIPDYEYTLTLNKQEHSGSPDPALSWSVVAVNALDQVSLTPASGTATLARPATPTNVSHSWASGASTASADWSIDCDVLSGVVKRVLTIDGISRDLPVVGRYPYPVTLNAQEHSGTPDPVLSWSLVWVDALGQTSTTPASGTATNTAPAAVTLELFTGGNMTLGYSIGQSAARDLSHYELIITRDGATIATLRPDTTIGVYEVLSGPGVYAATVRAVDLFGQPSTATAASAGFFNPLTRERILSEAIYSDSVGNPSAALKGALADGNTTSSGTNYLASASVYRWTQIERPLTDRYLPLVFGRVGMASGSLTFYVATSDDDGQSWRYFAGPLGGVTSVSATLTEVASEAAAQAAAIAITNATTVTRWELPQIVEARQVRFYHRHTTVGYTLREAYAGTYLRADQLQAESVEALHIKSLSITGDKLFGTELGALKASLGQVVIDESGFLRSGQTAYNTGTGFWLGHDGATPKFSIGQGGGQGLTWNGTTLAVSGSFALSGIATIGASGGLYQGTGSFASPNTGLKIWNQSGIGRIATYAGGVEQVAFDTTGRLRASQVTLDERGISHRVTNDTIVLPGFQFYRTNDSTFIGALRGGVYDPGTAIHEVGLHADTDGAGGARVLLAAAALPDASTNGALLEINSIDGISATTRTSDTTGAGTLFTFARMSTGTPANNFGAGYVFALSSSSGAQRTAGVMVTRWAQASDLVRRSRLEFYASDAAGNREGLRIESDGNAPQVGFYGVAAVSRQLVAAAAINATDVITLANSIRTILVTIGIARTS